MTETKLIVFALRAEYNLLGLFHFLGEAQRAAQALETEPLKWLRDGTFEEDRIREVATCHSQGSTYDFYDVVSYEVK